MSGRNNQDISALFPLYLIIFFILNWGVWWHYQTLRGPTVLATVVDKHTQYHKNTYHHYLDLRFITLDNQSISGELQVDKHNYPAFQVNDKLPVKYAREAPEEFAFLGEPFFNALAVGGYGLLVLILVSSGISLRRKYKRRNAKARGQRQPPAPAYSAVRTLAWTAAGVVAFGSGIVSCRRASNELSDAATPREYAHATVLRVQYLPATSLCTALVRFPLVDFDSSTVQVRVPLTAEQHALLRAKLSRPQTQPLEVLVAYPTAAPEEATLADQERPTSSPYNTVGIVLCTLGALVVGINLEKYVRNSNNW
ncbi:hypothetical protein MTX78_03325 [Hymenobacter tibetensis]|uniref:DUF3592 domain-containing protein n=1 Tax=Hymenobacter tibetensis TaxID=497967 RepID=A0ABY4D341_9BACT|nr:hypothetical protein [Hymenobacter tibetensis]UOG75629.1 hypothetical protein MTX78_03325 [Hymenobacter tibetensis]